MERWAMLRLIDGAGKLFPVRGLKQMFALMVNGKTW
jgi:hypothetical protein